MKKKTKKSILAMIALAAAFSAFGADPAVPYTFSPADTTAGFTPANAFSWADSGNWTSDGGGWPNEVGQVVDFCGTSVANTRYILLPTGNYTILSADALLCDAAEWSCAAASRYTLVVRRRGDRLVLTAAPKGTRLIFR